MILLKQKAEINKKKHWIMKVQINFLKEEKKVLMVLKAKKKNNPWDRS